KSPLIFDHQDAHGDGLSSRRIVPSVLPGCKHSRAKSPAPGSPRLPAAAVIKGWVKRISPMRVLVVEDDTKIAGFVVQGLRQAGLAVDHRPNGEDGLHLALTEPYAAAVIDLMLPRLDGLSLIEELRRRKINTPVLILSAKRSVDDRVKGLQTGGDDYLT